VMPQLAVDRAEAHRPSFIHVVRAFLFFSLASPSQKKKTLLNTMTEATPQEIQTDPATKPTKAPRRITRRRRNTNKAPVVDPVLLEKTLRESNLPNAYSFEILKTIQRVVNLNATHIALQMPEGLLLYATVLSDVFQRLAPCLEQVSILGDVTYGACCIDDLGAQALGAQLLVHYGHSCLVPIQHTAIPCLYVFVELTIDVPHVVDCLNLTVAASSREKLPHVYLLGTIQFRHSLVQAQELLEEKGYSTSIPQAKPLSPGEVLGCTSPVLAEDTASDSIVLFVSDGRFHLESTMISNPQISTFYRYDPYSKTMTEESYEHEKMKNLRLAAIEKAKSAKVFGILLGTLGRQGNPGILFKIQEKLKAKGKRNFIMLVSEITPAKLALLESKIDAWVQIACPRLSVDWGHHLSTNRPVLNPYELFVCLEETPFRKNYPMDYYSEAGGPWSNYHEATKERQVGVS
jgi:2-(3-amino-3-carboxypropyl)histidine synthase